MKVTRPPATTYRRSAAPPPPDFMRGRGPYPAGLLNPTPRPARTPLTGLLQNTPAGGGQAVPPGGGASIEPQPTPNTVGGIDPQFMWNVAGGNLPQGGSISGPTASGNLQGIWSQMSNGPMGTPASVSDAVFNLIANRLGYTQLPEGQTPTLSGAPMQPSSGQWAANAANSALGSPPLSYGYGSDLAGSTEGGINLGIGGIGSYGGYGGSNWLTGNSNGFGAFGGGWGNGWDSFGGGLGGGFGYGGGGGGGGGFNYQRFVINAT